MMQELHVDMDSCYKFTIQNKRYEGLLFKCKQIRNMTRHRLSVRLKHLCVVPSTHFCVQGKCLSLTLS